MGVCAVVINGLYCRYQPIVKYHMPQTMITNSTISITVKYNYLARRMDFGEIHRQYIYYTDGIIVNNLFLAGNNVKAA